MGDDDLMCHEQFDWDEILAEARSIRLMMSLAMNCSTNNFTNNFTNNAKQPLMKNHVVMYDEPLEWYTAQKMRNTNLLNPFDTLALDLQDFFSYSSSAGGGSLKSSNSFMKSSAISIMSNLLSFLWSSQCI